MITNSHFRDYQIHISADKLQLCIKSTSTAERLVTPYTGHIDRHRKINKMFSSCGRLALLQDGRVYVFCLGQCD